MTVLAATDLDNAISKISSQPDRRAHADTILSTLCTCPSTSSVPIDLSVACILRLLCLDIDLIYSSPHRQHLLHLIRERLEETQPRLLKDYKVTDATQADEVCRHLAHLMEDGVADLANVVSIYRGLDTLPRLRQRLLQTLNSSRCAVAINPFLNLGTDTTEILNTCLGRVIEYLQADVYHAHTAHANALDSVSWMLRAFEISPTTVATPLSSLFLTIRDDLTEHAQSNPHLQPARLHLDVDLRRHPLHEPALHLTIPIVLINDGEGTAANIEVQWTGAIGLKELGPPVRLQSIGPGRMIIEMTAQTDPATRDPEHGALCAFTIDWVNGDGTLGQYQDEHLLKTQDTTVDWDRLTRSNPYSLDAVRKPADLVGRTQILNRIISTLNTDTVGSLYIHGEKRVGKTSLAHVALNILNHDYGMSTVFVDIGDIHNPTPTIVIDKLAHYIFQRLGHRSRQWSANDRLDSDGTLAPLIDYLHSVVDSRNRSRIVIALDEFDRLPRTLLQRTTEADNFSWVYGVYPISMA